MIAPLTALILSACGPAVLDVAPGDDSAQAQDSSPRAGPGDSARGDTGAPMPSDSRPGPRDSDAWVDSQPEPWDSGADDPERAWASFLEARGDHLGALGEVVLDCVGQIDTTHPVFRGCIDWHSAVHGIWALHALYRLTGDDAWLEAAEAALDPAGLEEELAQLRAGRLDHELPYGFAWLLALAREREEATGATDLRPLAAEIAQRLEDWMRGLSASQILAGARHDEYDNLSWAALNLYQHAAWSGDDERAAVAEAVVIQLAALDHALPLTADTAPSGFFPPALHRARAILEVLPPGEAADWAEGFLTPPEHLALAPLTSFPGAHEAGLNFSRAWGLWRLADHTGDPAWRDLYRAHVEAHINQPAYWAEDYYRHSHWVPQFGIYAIALTY